MDAQRLMAFGSLFCRFTPLFVRSHHLSLSLHLPTCAQRLAFRPFPPISSSFSFFGSLCLLPSRKVLVFYSCARCGRSSSHLHRLCQVFWAGATGPHDCRRAWPGIIPFRPETILVQSLACIHDVSGSDTLRLHHHDDCFSGGPPCYGDSSRCRWDCYCLDMDSVVFCGRRQYCVEYRPFHTSPLGVHRRFLRFLLQRFHDRERWWRRHVQSGETQE